VCGLNDFDVLVTDAADNEPALANTTVSVVQA
jgi:hypothetical protein